MARYELKIDQQALKQAGKKAVSGLASSSIEMKCAKCDTKFRPSTGKVVCPNCKVEYRLQ